MKCQMCENKAEYRCLTCGSLICGNHAYFGTICQNCIKKEKIDFFIYEASHEDKEAIGKLVEFFWGEPQQTAFGKTILVREQPAFVAVVKDKIVGFVSFCEFGENDVLIVALGILPQYQGSGIGKALISTVEEKARELSKKRILVSTSNDNLPALAFYQLMGYQIFEVAPNVIAEKHRAIYKGIGNIPIRDEIRLRKNIE